LTGREDDERSRVGLNLTLYVVALLSLGVAVVSGVVVVHQHRVDGGDVSGGWWDRLGSVVADRRSDVPPSRAGEPVGDALVEAVPEAAQEYRTRTAALIDAATVMATAFFTISYEDPEATFETVRGLATGRFLDRYDRSTERLRAELERARSVITGEVEWTGVVASDDHAGTVLVAASALVQDKATGDDELLRRHRIKVDLSLEDGRWLVRDLEFVG
jgi:hypothetical protein